MTFSQRTKEELAARAGASGRCGPAELAALIPECGQYMLRPGGRLELLVETGSFLAAQRIMRLTEKAFFLRPEAAVYSSRQWKSRVYRLAFFGENEPDSLLKKIGYQSRSGVLRELALPPREDVLPDEECRRAYLRGLFLCTGSLSDPSRSYHLEFVLKSPEKAAFVKELLQSLGFDAGRVCRKGSEIVYSKNGDDIADFLGMTGAVRSLTDYENARILKSIGSTVNRRLNCEMANLNKTVAASVSLQKDILLIESTIGLDALPQPLREAAELKTEHPDLPLADLGELMRPPVGKSGMNHRFRRLRAIAEKLREKQAPGKEE